MTLGYINISERSETILFMFSHLIPLARREEQAIMALGFAFKKKPFVKNPFLVFYYKQISQEEKSLITG